MYLFVIYFYPLDCPMCLNEMGAFRTYDLAYKYLMKVFKPKEGYNYFIHLSKF